MLAQLLSTTLSGLEAHPVRVEVDLANGLPGLHLVGLPDASISEAGARVRAALRNSGFTYPLRRITVNLSPGHLRKQGPCFDLAVALGILAASGQLEPDLLNNVVVVGELALDGRLVKVRGLIPTLLKARQMGPLPVLIPADNLPEATVVEGVEVKAVSSLSQAVAVLRGESEPIPAGPFGGSDRLEGPNLSQVKGQREARRVLEIAAAGSHHWMMIGPPGCGKTLLARCLASVLPPLEEKEQLEVMAVESVCSSQTELSGRAPFRAPGNGCSRTALLGGRRPGEVTRAHRGVLFLDEFPEFRRDCLEGLRTVLDRGEVEVVRHQFQAVYPAQVMLVAAMNPCPCGFAGDPDHECRCSDRMVSRYRARLSGALSDRFDLLTSLSRPAAESYFGGPPPESSAEVKKRVAQARALQRERGELNCELELEALERHLGKPGRRLVTAAVERFSLSVRAYLRWLRVARTIADLEGKAKVSKCHLSEALSYRLEFR